ncbi:MAG: hypothetical protein AAF385_12085 [Pseudomonadota bacterium]
MNKKLLLILGAVLTLAGAGWLASGFLGGGESPGNLRLQIETKPAVMSASYKVHANKELKSGRYWVAKLLLINEGPGSLENVKVAYRIPGYVDWTSPRPYPEILANQTVVDLFYPRFPAKLSEKLTTSTEQIEMKVTYTNNGEPREEFRKVDFDLRGRNDLIYTTMDSDEIASITDVYENTDLVASFVTPEDPVIKYFTQQLQQKVLGGTTAGVSNDPNEVLRFMKGVYDYQVAAGVVYGGTLGLPEKIGSSYTVVQKVRMPREVITGEAGLCIELSTLFASVALSAGLKPVIFMTARHAWPGIQLADGSIIPIEATTINGEGIGGVGSFEDAIKAGQKNMQIFMAGGDNSIGQSIGLLDISALHTAGIRPPELADDAALNQRLQNKIEKLVAGASKSSSTKKKSTRRASNTGGGSTGRSSARPPQPRNVPAGFQAFQHPTGAFRLGYPNGWSTQVSPYPQFPQLAAVIAQNPNGLGPAAEIYMFPGVGSAQEAMNTLAYTIESFGGYMQGNPSGSVSLQGANYQMFNGQTQMPNASFEWRSYVRVVSGGTVGVVISAPMGSLGNYNQVLSQIADTFVYN